MKSLFQAPCLGACLLFRMVAFLSDLALHLHRALLPALFVDLPSPPFLNACRALYLIRTCSFSVPVSHRPLYRSFVSSHLSCNLFSSFKTYLNYCASSHHLFPTFAHCDRSRRIAIAPSYHHTSLSAALAMLLPSAFSCDGGLQPQSRPQRPKLPSFTAYQPQYSTSARPSPLSSSCRALQAILGAPGAISRSAPNPSRELDNPFELPEAMLAPKKLQQPPPRSANKRRRSEFEEDMPSDILMGDCRTPESIRTPKRRRNVPLSMPLGLSADDFRALETPGEEVELDMPSSSPHARHSDDDSAYGSSPPLEDLKWNWDDDRMLVEIVLEKLKLSKRDWNDCARRLGKERDSLERRWSLLVGEGNVGLRRGGRISRTDLDILSW